MCFIQVLRKVIDKDSKPSRSSLTVSRQQGALLKTQFCLAPQYLFALLIEPNVPLMITKLLKAASVKNSKVPFPSISKLDSYASTSADGSVLETKAKPSGCNSTVSRLLWQCMSYALPTEGVPKEKGVYAAKGVAAIVYLPFL